MSDIIEVHRESILNIASEQFSTSALPGNNHSCTRKFTHTFVAVLRIIRTALMLGHTVITIITQYVCRGLIFLTMP